MTKKKKYNAQLINEIKIHTGLAQHANIIRFAGFYYSSDSIFAILLESAENCLLRHVRVTFENSEDDAVIEFSLKKAVEIINGLV
jgi:hypothetical protein